MTHTTLVHDLTITLTAPPQGDDTIIASVALVVTSLWLMQVPVGGEVRLDPAALVRILLIAAIAAGGALMAIQTSEKYRESAWSNRNFYGVLYVIKQNAPDPRLESYKLLHGRTIHGIQYVQPALRRIPTAYFASRSGVGLMRSM